jgi:hypothetical protein
MLQGGRVSFRDGIRKRRLTEEGEAECSNRGRDHVSDFHVGPNCYRFHCVIVGLSGQKFAALFACRKTTDVGHRIK